MRPRGSHRPALGPAAPGDRAALDGDARDEILTSLRGVGVWTSAETRIRAFGDPDAVSVGDYHLAHQVGFALTGHRVDDDGMRELLAPWAGHRQRVLRTVALRGSCSWWGLPSQYVTVLLVGS